MLEKKKTLDIKYRKSKYNQISRRRKGKKMAPKYNKNEDDNFSQSMMIERKRGTCCSHGK